jgi:hypothetical protein
MESDRFNGLFRVMCGDRLSRRTTLRALGYLLPGCALSRVLTGLGSTELAQAKAKRKRNKRRHRRKPPTQPQPCGATCTDDGGRCCPDGSCAPHDACCPGERRCGDGSCLREEPFTCCPEEWGCDDGTCVPAGGCCAIAIPPSCDKCEEVVCVNGELRCQLKPCPSPRRLDERACTCV